MKKKISRILISQPKPSNELSPYYSLTQRLKVNISFIPFIRIEGLSAAEVRRNKINVRAFSFIIFTSKNAVDHYFRIIKEAHYELPTTAKFFCVTESVSLYLQNHISVKKRNVLAGKSGIEDLEEYILKHKNAPFLVPSSSTLSKNSQNFLNGLGIQWRQGMMYRAVPADLKSLTDENFDVLVLFTPGDVESLYYNFPDFQQKNIKIAIFGKTTLTLAQEKKLSVDIIVPSEKWQSMNTALEDFVKNTNAIKSN